MERTRQEAHVPRFQNSGAECCALLAEPREASGSHLETGGCWAKLSCSVFPLFLALLTPSTPTPSLHFMVGEELENPLMHIRAGINQ